MYFITFLSMILEICLSLTGVQIPLLGFGGFYFTLIYGWEREAFPYLFCTTLLDLALGRFCPVSLLSCTFIMIGASYWRRYGNLHEETIQIIPGMGIGICYALVSLLYAIVLGGISSGRFVSASPVPYFLQIFCAMILFPAYCWILDILALGVGGRRYRFVHKYHDEEDEP